MDFLSPGILYIDEIIHKSVGVPADNEVQSLCLWHDFLVYVITKMAQEDDEVALFLLTEKLCPFVNRLEIYEKLISDEKFEASNEPLISVIVITYNKENNIMKSIRSIQNQSFKNIEIIIVDD